jgi:GcrA cell cycle regulator
LGKIHRLRLDAAKVAKAPKAKRPMEAEKKKPPGAALPNMPSRRRRGRNVSGTTLEPDPTVRPGRKTLLELTNKCCRWPLGRQGGKGYFFCGAVADLESGRPYCERHMRRAYIIAPPIVVKVRRLPAHAA